MNTSPESRAVRTRSRATGVFHTVEHGFYMLVAVALGAAGAALFGYAIADFVDDVGDGSFIQHILELLDTLLLVFIVTELLHTVRAIIDQNVLLTEPFLIVGIVAVIRRLIVISAEAQDALGTDQFGDVMVEMAILVGAVVGLGATVFLLRRTEHPEPRPAHEPDAE